MAPVMLALGAAGAIVASAHVSTEDYVELVTAWRRDPRIHLRPVSRGSMTMIPLTRRPGGVQAYKLILPAGSRREPELKTHEGYEWLYVLNGRLRAILGEHDLVLTPGEAVEFDTRLPHWFGPAGDDAVEFLSLFGAQGERAHLRAGPRRTEARG